MTFKVLKTKDYIAKTAHRTPVLLGWEVDNQVIIGFVDVRLTKLNLMPIAALNVVAVHRGVTLLECKRNTLAHDADSIHCIH